MPLRSNLGRIARGIAPAADRGVETAAGFVADVERQLVPVDDGDLYDTIRVAEKERDMERSVIAGDPTVTKQDGRPVDYVSDVEYGTDVSGAQPFVEPAAEQIKPEIEVRKELQALIRSSTL